MGMLYTLQQLDDKARQYGDFVSNFSVSQAASFLMVQDSWQTLYNIVIGSENLFNVAQTQIVTVAQQQFYPLPADFFRSKGVEILKVGNVQWYDLDRFEWKDRNKWSFAPPAAAPYGQVLEYCDQGVPGLSGSAGVQQLMIIPLPNIAGGQVLRLWYYPTATQLVNPTDTVDLFVNGAEFIATDVAIKLRDTVQRDTSVLQARLATVKQNMQAAVTKRDSQHPHRVTPPRHMRRGGGWGGYGGGR